MQLAEQCQDGNQIGNEAAADGSPSNDSSNRGNPVPTVSGDAKSSDAGPSSHDEACEDEDVFSSTSSSVVGMVGVRDEDPFMDSDADSHVEVVPPAPPRAPSPPRTAFLPLASSSSGANAPPPEPPRPGLVGGGSAGCLLYTSDAADE